MAAVVAALAVALAACGAREGSADLAAGRTQEAVGSAIRAELAAAARSVEPTVPVQPTTTTTTAPPAPTTTALAPVPATVPITAAPAPAPSRSARCAAARSAVAAAGLKLPAGFGYTCAPSIELYPGDRDHWGTMCSHHAPECPTSAYIAANIDLIGPSDARLRYVVAHETCHALDSAANRPTSEPGADACAAAAGFSRV